MTNENLATSGAIKTTTTLTLLLGIWYFISPWVYGSYMSPDSWNNWIVGAIIVIFAAIRYNHAGARPLSFLNMLLGAWTFASPWIFAYTDDTARFVNSLCVGFIVFVLAAYGSANLGRTPLTGPPPALRT